MSEFLSRNWDDLILPLLIILGALAVGVVFERLIGRGIYRTFERKNWKIGRRLVRSFNGILTVWCGIIAFRAVLPELPLKASAIPVAEKLVSAILLLTFAVLIGRIIVAFIRTYSSEHDRAMPSITLVENIVRAVLYVLAVLAIFRTFGVAVTPMLTALGVGGLAVALALQDTLSNFFAGLYIILSKQLDPGDFIKLSTGEEGTIRDIAWRVTTLRTVTNTLIIVPNSKFATSTITNYDRPEKSTALAIPFTLDSQADLKAFEAIAIQSGREAATVLPDIVPSEPIFEVLSLSSTGVQAQLTIQITDYLHHVRIRNEILKRMHTALRNTQALPRTVMVREEPVAKPKDAQTASDD